MKVARIVVGISCVASVTLGCSRSTAVTQPSSLESAVDLAAPRIAGSWNLVSIQPAGEGEQPKPSGARYTLTLADGRLSTRADCNSCGGAYTLNGQSLVAGPALACTRAACATMAFENGYMRLLSGESTVSISGGALVVTSARGVLRFAEC